MVGAKVKENKIPPYLNKSLKIGLSSFLLFSLLLPFRIFSFYDKLEDFIFLNQKFFMTVLPIYD